MFTCFSDCTGLSNQQPDLTCAHRTLTVSWLTNTTFTADVTEVPAELRRRLTDRLASIGSLQIVVVNMDPP